MKRIYIPLLIALAVSSCQEENLQPSSPAIDPEMRFNLMAPGARTKASDAGFDKGDKIGIYVTDWVDDETPMPLQVSGNRANNLPLTFDGEAWTPTKTIYWGKGKSDVYAYYPYLDEVDDVNAQDFSVALDQNEKGDETALGGYEASDLLWAKAAGVAQAGGPVTLPMKHVMSKLTVKIVAGEDYVGELPEDATVLLHSTVTDARIDLETGAVVKNPYSGAKTIKMKKIGLRTSNEVQAVVYEAVVVPQMLETSVPLLEINSKSVSYLLEDLFNFRPGVAYTYTVTLNTSTTAIKVEIGCELEDWNDTGDDDDEEEGGDDEGDSGDEEDDSAYINLSSEGTANSYIVSEAGSYKFKAVQGNMDATVGNVKTVEVLWESFGTDQAPQVGDLIAEASFRNGYICFSTPESFVEGNAVIAAKNSAGKILWSWHIWLTDVPEVHVYNNKSGIMMDRNLGATTAEAGEVGSLGLMYQWGRKDPFLGSASVSEAIDAASTGTWTYSSSTDGMSMIDWFESNPMSLNYSYNSYSYNEMIKWTLNKSVTDPCPVGWRVPQSGENGIWTRADMVMTPLDYENYGMYLHAYYPDVVWYPASGYRSENGQLHNVGVNGYYSAILDEDKMGSMYYTRQYLGSDNMSSDLRAAPIRCYRDYEESFLPEVEVPEIVISSARSLSDWGTANSYVVSSAGTYSIAAVKGNSAESVGAADNALVVWESFGTDVKPVKGDLISAVKYENGRVYFRTADTFKEGNALIAVKDAKGKILWSWHIWMTDMPKAQVYYNNAGTMMDRNLGATSATPGDPDVMGLTYQWGRKDPFMGQLVDDQYKYAESTYLWPAEYNNYQTYDYSISHPTVKISYTPMYDTESGKFNEALWQSKKSIYDPCPSGWRVPDGGPDGIWAKAKGENAEQFFTNHGLNYSGVLGDDKTIFYPVSGDALTSIWSATYDNNDDSIYTFYYYPHGQSYAYWHSGSTSRNYVRCQKDK